MASRLSTKLDKFTRGSIKVDKRSPSGNRKGLQENSFRDLRNLTSNNIPPPSPTLNTSKGHHQSRAFSPRTNRAALLSPRAAAHATTELRSSINHGSVSSPRYYHHMHHRHLPPTPWSPPTSKTLDASNNCGGSHAPNHYIHPPRCVDLADDDFENCAFNGNVCLCEEQWSGTQRLGISNGRLMRSMSGSSGPCRKCGLDKLIIKPGSQRIRKAQSEESVTNGDPYDLVRRQRLIAAEQEHQQHMLLHHHHHVHLPPHHPHTPHHIHHHLHPTSPPLQIEMSSNPAMQWFEDHLDQPPINDDEEEEEANNGNDDNDEDDHALEYAEADYIYNAVSRRLPIPPTIPQSVLQMRHQKRLEIEALIKKQHRSKSQTKPEGFHPLVRSSSSVVRSSSANKVFSTTFNSLKRKVKDDQKIKSRQRPPSTSQDPTPPNLPLPPPPVPSSTRPSSKTHNNMPRGAPLSSVSAVTSAMNKTQKSNRMKTNNKSSNYKSVEDMTSSSSPLSSVPSESSASNNEIVTVNGGHGTKNSSIIYLSPDRSTPSRSLSTNTSDTEKRGSEQNGETLIRIKRNGKSGQHMKTINSSSANHQNTTMVTINDSNGDTTVLPVTQQDNNTRFSSKLMKHQFDIRDESETDLDERVGGNIITSDTNGDNDTADTSEKETSADEVSDDSVLQSGKSHQDKVLKLTKQNEERRKQLLDKNSDKIHTSKTNKNALDKKELIIDLEQCEEDSDYDADLSTLESPNKVKAMKDKVSLVQGNTSQISQPDPHRQKIIVKGPKHQMRHHLSHESIQKEDSDEITTKPLFQFSKNRLQNFPQKLNDSSQRVIKRVDGATTSSDSDSIGGLNSRRSSLSGDELAPGGIKSSRASTSKLVQLYQRRKQMQQFSLSNENTYSEPPEDIDLNKVSISDSRKNSFSNHIFKDYKNDSPQKSLPPHLGSTNKRPEANQDDNIEDNGNFASLTSFQQIASK